MAMAKPTAVKRSFLSKLHTNGVYFVIGALILLLVAPLYQLVVLVPQGYGIAPASTDTTYLLWIVSHRIAFLVYRLLLIIAFACLLNLPFTLFRIIVAQEILGREEESELEEEEGEEKNQVEGMPNFAWRGKGYAVLAAWAGFFGIVISVLGTLVGTLYLLVIGPQSIASSLSGVFAIITNTVGGGLLALASLLFGVVIARSGHNLWPGVWVTFGYTSLALAAFFSASAVAVASAPNSQALFTTLAILLFGIWVLWFGVMLVRLKPE